MGQTESVVDPFPTFLKSPHSSSISLLNLYRTRDYDFGIDSTILTSLLQGNGALADQVSKKFGGSAGVVNALSFISAVIILGNAYDEPDPIRAKTELIFDLFDFHESGDMSLDEVTILLLSTIRAVNLVTGADDEPKDETMEQYERAL
jgi:hypothetical protein